MTRVKAILLVLRIEYHWWHIKQGRKKFDDLYDTGLHLGSPQIQDLNTRISKHAARLMACEKKYMEQYSRCDLHARWRHDGKQLAFNSVHEGTRQVYLRNVIWK